MKPLTMNTGAPSNRSRGGGSDAADRLPGRRRGDWAFHRHKSHHTMNAMGHDAPTTIGVDHRGVAKQITQLIPDHMVMGELGMKDMTEMEMPLPDNTAAMMTGTGPFGAVGVGGMFSVVKVRKPKGGHSGH